MEDGIGKRIVNNVDIIERNQYSVNIKVEYLFSDTSSGQTTVYKIYGNGEIEIENKFVPFKNNLPELPRFGLTMELPRDFENIKWFGRGPHENYCDRKTSALVGLYESTVDEQFVLYISPQENGYKTETRWLQLTDKTGKGLKIIGEPLFGFSALFYTTEDLTQKKRGRLHTYQLKKRNFISLNIDLKQMGVGGDNSWGARTHTKYILPDKVYKFNYKLMPITN